MSSRAGRRNRVTTQPQPQPTTNAASTDDAPRLSPLLNAVLSRAALWSRNMDRRRDLSDECGWPKTENITVEQYRDLYDRHPLASRVVEFWPSECWKIEPKVYEDESPEVQTPFEAAWDSLGSSLRGDSWHQQEMGSPVWEYLQRLDILSGVGHFGVLLIGLDDGQELSQPAVRREGQQVTFLRVFDESLVQISSYESDRKSPRYGQPTKYLLTFNDPRDGYHAGAAEGSAVGLTTQNQHVHWTRVIHVADNLGSSEVFGVPRCRPVLNPLLDAQKIYGSSAEGYYKAAFNALSLETNPQLGGDVEIDTADLRDQIEQFQNGLQRILALRGMVANSIAPVATDPAAHIETQIDAICIQIGAPKRKFMGSERGELASSQDSEDLNTRTTRRRNTYLTPRLIVPFADRLISLGVLPEPSPERGYCIYWPEPETVSELEKANIAVLKTDAMSKYVQGNVEDIMPLPDYLTRVLDLSDEDAESITDALDTRTEDEEYTAEEEPELPPGGFAGGGAAGGFPNG